VIHKQNFKKSIMVLGAGEAQIPIIQKCMELNLFTIVVDFDQNAVGFKFASKKLLISTNDYKEVLKAAIEYGIDGIITTSDYPVRVIAYVCEKLGLKGLSVKAAEICTNKYLLRKCLKENNILSPVFLKISNIEELKQEKHRLNFPLIIKPVDSSASRGVKKLINEAELETSYFEAKSHSKCGDVVIEDFIEGPEYSIEVLCYREKIHVLAFTEKTTSGFENAFFVEDRHIIPAKVTEEDEKQISLTIIDAIKKIGLDNCAVHTEIKLTANGPVIIEVGARLGGDYISSDLVPLSTGINMHEQAINICLNNEIDVKPSKLKYAGVQFINSDNYKAASVHLGKIKTKPGFVRSEQKDFKKISLKSSLDRLGHYICIGETREELVYLLDFDGDN
jgi:carbamoyl-phosphate synthase large subunit